MRKFLLMSSALVLGLSGAAEAACIQTPTCSSLGYTSSSSCTGGVKCPFGNAWNCTASNIVNQITEINNKITEITNKITEIENGCCSGSGGESSKCQVGSFLFSDKSCSNVLEPGKTPIGVVVYKDASGHGQAMALKDIEGNFIEMRRDEANGYCQFYNIQPLSGLPNLATQEEAIKDFDSCGNTDRLLADSSSSYLTAAKLIRNYKTAGTNAGDWCMPAAGILNEVHKNQLIINNSMTLAGGFEMEGSLSSTLARSGYDVVVWYLNDYLEFGTYTFGEYLPSYETSVCGDYFYKISRPVIEFQE